MNIQPSGLSNTERQASPRGLTPQDYGLVKVAYSVTEALALLSIGRTTLYGLVKRGELTPAKLGTKTLFLASDIAALLTKLRQPKAA